MVAKTCIMFAILQMTMLVVMRRIIVVSFCSPLTQSLQAADVGLSPCEEDLQISSLPLFAPVCHMNVFESPYFTIGIFIIRKGMKIPLHDHPGMTGICKTLYGSLKIISYQSKDGTLSLEEQSSLDAIPVTRLPDTISTLSTPCHVLTPQSGNFHMVESVGEDAAMFDILSPPYSEGRDCHYFRDVIGSSEGHYFLPDADHYANENSQRYLLRVPQPYNFYCDSLSYKGPAIDVENIDEEL